MNDDWVRACSRNVIIILDHNHARPCRVSSREQNELLHRHRNTSQNPQESFFFPTPAPTETLFFMFFFTLENCDIFVTTLAQKNKDVESCREALQVNFGPIERHLDYVS